MTDLTSAKSRLTRPGIVIKSEILWTPWPRTESAVLKASRSDWSFWRHPSSVVRITIRVSTFSFSFSILHRLNSTAGTFKKKRFGNYGDGQSLLFWKFRQSPLRVPGPPPSPAVIKTMSAPIRTSLIFSRDSSAAVAPISDWIQSPDLGPFSPIWIEYRHWSKKCLHVG